MYTYDMDTKDDTTEYIETTKIIKYRIKSTADYILKNSGTHRDYTDEDLSNAVLIFQEVFSSKMWDKYNRKYPFPFLEHMAKDAGMMLRDVIMNFTGVDLHHVNDVCDTPGTTSLSSSES